MKTIIHARLSACIIAAFSIFMCSCTSIPNVSKKPLSGVERSFVGTWVTTIPVSSGGRAVVVNKVFPDRTDRGEAKYRGQTKKNSGRWMIENGILSGNFSEYAIKFVDNKKIKLTVIYDSALPKGTELTAFKYSDEPQGNYESVVEWYHNMLRQPVIVNPAYVSNTNSRGIPPDENGWIFNDKVGFHPPPEAGEEAILNWLIERVATAFITNGLTDAFIKMNENDGPTVIGALFHTIMDRSTKQAIDNILEVALPDIPVSFRNGMRNTMFAVFRGDLSLNSLPERTTKTEFVRMMRDYNESAGETAYWVFFTESVLKYLSKK